jgi:hypothetical protein
MRNYYKPGCYNIICDSCGRKFKNDEVRKDWRGLMVCAEDYETRHPQTLIQVPTDNPTVPIPRPEPADKFVTVNYISTTIGHQETSSG